jgi:hypothetical protein
MFRCRGTARSNPLNAHHRNVLELVKRYDLRVACDYDRKIRELMAYDKRYDPSAVKPCMVLQAYLDSGTAMTNARLCGYR